MDQAQAEKQRRTELREHKPKQPPAASELEDSLEPVEITDCTDVVWWAGGKIHMGRVTARASSGDPRVPNLLRIEVHEHEKSEPITASVWETDPDLALVQNRHRLYERLQDCQTLLQARPDLRDRIEERRASLQEALGEDWG